MKVLLIGNYLADEQYSMQGFANALLSGLCERGIEARLLVPTEFLGRLPVPKLSKWLGYGDKFFVFPQQLKRALREADVVHLCDQGNAMYTKYLMAKPHLMTCHDLLAIRAAQGELPDQQTGTTGQALQRMILKGIVRAQSIACVSETTRQDLLRIGAIPEGRTRVIYNGLYRPVEKMPEEPAKSILRTLNIPPDAPFLLHVGGNQFYKNRLGLLRIYRALLDRTDFDPLCLVMAGKPLTAEMRHYIAEQHLENRVIERVEPNNEALRALYSRAKALIFPSLYEGFGLPIIEAQSCGCPVFASSRAPMTEAGGSAAVYFDPQQPIQAAQIIAENLSASQAQREAGFKNVERFTTKRMIDDYIQTYRNLLAS